MERADLAYQDECEDIPARVNDVLDPRSISPADIQSDDYDETQSIEEYLRTSTRCKS